MSALEELFANQSIAFDSVMLGAVANYAATRLDFADCLLAALSQATGLPVISYDRGYRTFSDMIVRTPAQQLAALARP